MHETWLAKNILDSGIEVAQREGAKRIVSISLRIGAMSGVVPDALKFALEILSEETIAKGCQVKIEFIPLKIFCECCQITYSPEDFCFICPNCTQSSEKIIQGREFEISSIEVE